MGQIYNFSAGPSVLPKPVLEKVQEELLSYQGLGMSVMEMSHRSQYFEEIIKQAENLLRQLMNIPQNYKVLFIQGGASLQFSMVPMNLLHQYHHAYYVDSGSWSEKAIKEAKKHGEITILASSKEENYTKIPPINLLDIKSNADYLHITTNNTIEGTRFSTLPETGNIPLVADMSSNILSEVYDVSKFGLIYAGAQKNIGPAGLTVVIVREDLLGAFQKENPTMLNYETYSSSGSLYNTPPTFPIYVTKLVLEWLQALGGVTEMEKINRAKANLLYAFIEESSLFVSRVEVSSRSLMNIPFTTSSDQLNSEFLQFAASKGLITLEGHRSTGGMRASIYNAMPIEGVEKLVDCMKEFEIEHR
ncbi:phosphoserine aminotransferase [Bacillus mesophilus]|uniref:Phosphoserine aminotransferase n=1 Tax=Bacillus mesophilus TaxID=1808955 RepID=A0A6M0QBX5_9BACI|nr:3-phosphoserine/phosphohydroxythreonine transaminase [Bacillus mesophilus]MBM7662109.1 phosphoserine aminotransferase [Bacillus mesophilus]NEY72538.1 3-phosphoserine/phosphohydroxythreonine transaminase [Bacillus mesophilus]